MALAPVHVVPVEHVLYILCSAAVLDAAKRVR